MHYRLVGEHDAALVERSDDLVGDADVAAALRVTLGGRAPGGERAGTAALGGSQRLVRAADRLVGVARVTRYADRADRGGDRDRARFRRHHLVADSGEKTLGGNVHVLDGAVLQDQAELVAGEA